MVWVLGAVVALALAIYISLDVMDDFRSMRTDRDRLVHELDMRTQQCRQLNNSLLVCEMLVELCNSAAEDYRSKWEAERTISYSLWQILDTATNVSVEGADYTIVQVVIPRWQWDYLRNLSETYGLNYTVG